MTSLVVCLQVAPRVQCHLSRTTTTRVRYDFPVNSLSYVRPSQRTGSHVTRL